MTTFTSNHYGVKISCELVEYPGCCGASILKRFGADGRYENLSMGQKHEMYKELMCQVVSKCPGVVVATDAIVNFGPFADLSRSTSNWKKSDSAGDISLEDFCEYFGFTKSIVAKNKNSGNLIASYSLACNQADETDPTKSTPFHVDKPDFSDEPKKEAKKPDGDMAQILADINALLEE